MPMPQVGDLAPDFTLQDQNGSTVRLSDHNGRHVVLYFYPKDDTPGCTVEACDFRDAHAALSEANVVVLGISPDDTGSHQRFAGKFQLPFPLLADTDHQVAEAYGVWVEKNMYGKRSMGVQRATFLIGPDSKVERVWPRVKVEGHVEEVMSTLRAAISGPGVAPISASVAPEGEPPTVDAKREGPRSNPTRQSSRALRSAQEEGGGTALAGARRTTASNARKTPARKTPARKAAVKKTAAKKTAVKKAGVKKAGVQKAAVKRTGAHKQPSFDHASPEEATRGRDLPATRRAVARGKTSTAAARSRAAAPADAQHKTKNVAVRGKMKPGRNAPAGGAGTPKRTGPRRTRTT